jgi:hypothetical protein
MSLGDTFQTCPPILRMPVHRGRPEVAVVRTNRRERPWLFSNSGREVKLSLNVLAGSMVLSAVGACPPHDSVR